METDRGEQMGTLSRSHRVVIEVATGIVGAITLAQLDSEATSIVTTSIGHLARFGTLMLLTATAACGVKFLRAPWTPRYALMVVVILGITDILEYASAFQGTGRDTLVGLSWLYPVVLFEALVARPRRRLLLRPFARGWATAVAGTLALLWLALLDQDVLGRLAAWATPAAAGATIVVGPVLWRILSRGAPRLILALLLAASGATVIDHMAQGVDEKAGPVPMEAIGVLVVLGYIAWYSLCRDSQTASDAAKSES